MARLPSGTTLFMQKAHSKGGHFGPWENTEAFIEGIRETFRLANTSKHQK